MNYSTYSNSFYFYHINVKNRRYYRELLNIIITFQEGIDNMITKTIRCPKCKTEITVSGNPNEKIDITCSNCNLKGFFRIPGAQTDERAAG